MAPYYDESHILRYMVSVYTHHNDQEYDSHRNGVLDAVDIEHQLRQFFPDIYGQLVKTLYICAMRKDIVNRDVDWLELCRWRVRDLFGTQGPRYSCNT